MILTKALTILITFTFSVDNPNNPYHHSEQYDLETIELIKEHCMLIPDLAEAQTCACQIMCLREKIPCKQEKMCWPANHPQLHWTSK